MRWKCASAWSTSNRTNCMSRSGALYWLIDDLIVVFAAWFNACTDGRSAQHPGQPGSRAEGAAAFHFELALAALVRRGRHRALQRILDAAAFGQRPRSEEHTSELQSLMRISYAVFCLKKKKKTEH